MATKMRKTTRPWGNHLTKAIRARLAPETSLALRRAKTLFGISLAEFVRAGVENALAKSVAKAVAKIDDPRTPDSMKLRLTEHGLALFAEKSKRERRKSSESVKLLRDTRDQAIRDYEARHGGSIRKIAKTLKKRELDVSPSTVARVLRNSGRRFGNPHRAVKGKPGGHEREAAMDADPVDHSDLDAYTMPHDGA